MRKAFAGVLVLVAACGPATLAGTVAGEAATFAPTTKGRYERHPGSVSITLVRRGRPDERLSLLLPRGDCSSSGREVRLERAALVYQGGPRGEQYTKHATLRVRTCDEHRLEGDLRATFDDGTHVEGSVDVALEAHEGYD